MCGDNDIKKLCDLIDLIGNYSINKEKKISECPYDINLIEEFHINENAHTRILTRLLQYNKKGKDSNFPILRSFIENIVNKKSNIVISNNVISNPKIAEQQNYIDCLITEEGKYAIIIENKIYNAVDQDGQIDRYVDSAMKSCKEENIFVIYLTKNGEKTISKNAISLKTKSILGWQDDNNKGRFIPVSYTKDILGWLQKLNIKDDELNLKCVIEQYINYIQNNLSTNNDFMKITEELILKSLGLKNDFCKDAEKISDTKKELDELSKGMFATLKGIIEEKFPDNGNKEMLQSEKSDALCALNALDAFQDNEANGVKASLQQRLINKYLGPKLNDLAKQHYCTLKISFASNQVNNQCDLNIYFEPNNGDKTKYIWMRFNTWGLYDMQWGVYSLSVNDQPSLFKDKDLGNFKVTNDKHWIYGLSTGESFKNWGNNEIFVNDIIFSNNFIDYLDGKLNALFRNLEPITS